MGRFKENLQCAVLLPWLEDTVLRKKSSGRKMVKCKMTRYSEEDWKRRGRGTKKRAPFKTSQTFLKKKKKSKD